MNEMEITATRTPEIIAGEIRTFTASMLNNVIEIGRRMVEVKKMLPYGSFGKWIAENTGYSSSTANNFMRLFQEYGADQGCLFGAEVECQTFGKLSYSKALALLSVPKEEREQVARELDAEHLSTRELEKALAERDEWQKATVKAREEAMAEHERAKELEYDLEKARRAVEDAGPYKEKLAEAEKRVKELESRPVEVAVERDEEAVRKAAAEAKKAAEEAARAEMDKLRAKLQKAQADQRKAEEEKERAIRESPLQAEEARAEAEKARAEADELRKKLRAAESGAGEVAMLARQAQVNFEAAMDKIASMQDTHPDVAGRMLTGMERIVENLADRLKAVRG